MVAFRLVQTEGATAHIIVFKDMLITGVQVRSTQLPPPAAEINIHPGRMQPVLVPFRRVCCRCADSTKSPLCLPSQLLQIPWTCPEACEKCSPTSSGPYCTLCSVDGYKIESGRCGTLVAPYISISSESLYVCIRKAISQAMLA